LKCLVLKISPLFLNSKKCTSLSQRTRKRNSLKKQNMDLSRYRFESGIVIFARRVSCVIRLQSLRQFLKAVFRIRIRICWILLLKPKSVLLKKIIKICSFLNGSSSFRIKVSEKKKKKILKIIFCKKNSVILKELTWIQIRSWIRIHFYPVRIQDQDPDPHQN